MAADYTELVAIYYFLQVFAFVWELAPLPLLYRWRSHATMQRHHVYVLIARCFVGYWYCTVTIHSMPVWKPLWINMFQATSHFCEDFIVSYSIGFVILVWIEMCQLTHMWLLSSLDWCQCSEYLLQQSHRASTSIHNPKSETMLLTTAPQSVPLSRSGRIMAYSAFFLFRVDSVAIATDARRRPALVPTNNRTHLPTITSAQPMRKRAILLLVAAAVMWWGTSKFFHAASVWLGLIDKYGDLGALYMTTPSPDKFGCNLVDYFSMYCAAFVLFCLMGQILLTLPWTGGPPTAASVRGQVLWAMAWATFASSYAIYDAISNLYFHDTPITRAAVGPFFATLVWELCTGSMRAWYPVYSVWQQRRVEMARSSKSPETGLRRVLSHPNLRVTFTQFCAREYCPELPQYYLEHTRLLSAPTLPSSLTLGTIRATATIQSDGQTLARTLSQSTGFSSAQTENQQQLPTTPPKLRSSAPISPLSPLSPVPPAPAQLYPTSSGNPFLGVELEELLSGPSKSYTISRRPSAIAIEPSDPLMTRLRHLHVTYIGCGSLQEINISAPLRLRFEKALDAGDEARAVRAAEDIAASVFQSMLEGPYSRFAPSVVPVK
ncbi:hypothetical protein BC828DRAFT_438935 [Blastocladiella britannica]|nr:hypothetical protein BC828DRAFT_438935 [Blastocladiella britannica]